jgi:uncharacterized protein with HEPN domain
MKLLSRMIRLHSAFVRSLEIIGEASKQVDPDLRNRYAAIPWTKMARLRDKVIHHYFGVEYDLVWAVVREEIPKLDAALRDLLEREKYLPNLLIRSHCLP